MQSALCTDCGILQAKLKKDWTIQPFKLELKDELKPRKWSQTIYYLPPPTISTIIHGPKITRLNKIHISISKYPLSEVNLNSTRRNNIGHILLDYIAESTVRFTVITTIITYNTIPQRVFTFVLVPEHLQSKC